MMEKRSWKELCREYSWRNFGERRSWLGKSIEYAWLGLLPFLSHLLSLSLTFSFSLFLDFSCSLLQKSFFLNVMSGIMQRRFHFVMGVWRKTWEATVSAVVGIYGRGREMLRFFLFSSATFLPKGGGAIATMGCYQNHTSVSKVLDPVRAHTKGRPPKKRIVSQIEKAIKKSRLKKQCGDIGLNDALVYCLQCHIARSYCLEEIPEDLSGRSIGCVRTAGFSKESHQVQHPTATVTTGSGFNNVSSHLKRETSRCNTDTSGAVGSSACFELKEDEIGGYVKEKSKRRKSSPTYEDELNNFHGLFESEVKG